jgi:hypothetical protein
MRHSGRGAVVIKSHLKDVGWSRSLKREKLKIRINQLTALGYFGREEGAEEKITRTTKQYRQTICPFE